MGKLNCPDIVLRGGAFLSRWGGYSNIVAAPMSYRETFKYIMINVAGSVLASVLGSVLFRVLAKPRNFDFDVRK